MISHIQCNYIYRQLITLFLVAIFPMYKKPFMTNYATFKYSLVPPIITRFCRVLLFITYAKIYTCNHNKQYKYNVNEKKDNPFSYICKHYDYGKMQYYVAQCGTT